MNKLDSMIRRKCTLQLYTVYYIRLNLLDLQTKFVKRRKLSCFILSIHLDI